MPTNRSTPASPTNTGKQNGIPNATSQPDNDAVKICESSPPKPKLERTKSILKQSSKDRDRGDGIEPPLSPKREQITFAVEKGDDRGDCNKDNLDSQKAVDAGTNITASFIISLKCWFHVYLSRGYGYYKLVAGGKNNV